MVFEIRNAANSTIAKSILLALGVACFQATVGIVPSREAAAQSSTLIVPASEQASAFDKADRRARGAIEQIRCARRVAVLRQQLVFGPIDSLGARHQCTVADGQYIGIFFDSDTLFSKMTRSSAVDLGSSTRRVNPLDTMAILAVERAGRTAQIRGLEPFRRASRQYAPVELRLDGDSIEVWLIPVVVLMGSPVTVGGERGYVFTPDGRTVAREINAFDAMRALVLPDTGVVHITSLEHAVPSMSEFMVASELHDRGRQVVIDMQNESAMRAGEGSSAIWLHTPRHD